MNHHGMMLERRPSTEFIHTLCFESQDHDSMILNYSSLPMLVRDHSQDDIIAAIEQTVKDHMQANGLSQFVFHLFCTGMHVKNIHLHRNFIFRVTSMFREAFPHELAACYVHDAPFIFSQVFEIIKPFLNRDMRRRIIIVKNSSGEAHVLNASVCKDSREQARPQPSARYVMHPFRSSSPLHSAGAGRHRILHKTSAFRH